jgi:hypothetical protein
MRISQLPVSSAARRQHESQTYFATFMCSNNTLGM